MVRPGVNSAGQSSKPGQSSSYTKAGSGVSASTTATSKAVVAAATAAQYTAAKATVDAKIASVEAARAANRAAGITSGSVSQGDKQSYEQKIKNAMTPLTTAQQATLEQQVGAAAIFARVNADYNKATGGSATVATSTYTVPNSGGAKVNLATAEIIPPPKKILVSPVSYPIAPDDEDKPLGLHVIAQKSGQPVPLTIDTSSIDQASGSIQGAILSNAQAAYSGISQTMGTPYQLSKRIEVNAALAGLNIPAAARAQVARSSVPGTMAGIAGWLGSILGTGITARVSARRGR